MRLATVLFVAMCVGTPAIAATFSEAKSAYDRNQVQEAERLFAAVDNDKAASAKDRGAAKRELARIAWLIDGASKRALDHAAAARRIGDAPCDSSVMIARILRESGQSLEAVSAGDSLLSSCAEPSGRDEIRRHFIGALLDLAMKEPGKKAALLARADAEGRKFTIDAGVEAARVRLETALLRDDPAAAQAAWRDFFWLDDTDTPQALANKGVTAIFTKGARADATIEERLDLAELLMRAGFAIQAQRFADANRLATAASGHPTWRKLSTYWKERGKLEELLLRVNRGLARGKPDGGALAEAAKSATVALMTAAGEDGDPRTVLKKHYGLLGTVGKTSGYPSMHMGHLVEDRELVISQYGKTATIRYLSVDNMIANGFESWLWDGGPMVGGWQADGAIINVRPGYVASPLRAYAQTQDSAVRRELIARQKKRAAEDLAKLRARPVATLEGLNDRLQLQVVDRVAAVARSKAADEAGFRRAFLAEYSSATFNQSIINHEGRHAIDESLGLGGKVEQPVLEYQAKLSELSLAAYPRMALRNMNLNLEGEGPHDKAGARIFDEYRKWMEARTDQILGYDSALPVLAQLDKLSDDQIRQIARSLDPLPNGRSSPPKL